MKFIHIADVHLGAQPEAAVYSQSRGRELWERRLGSMYFNILQTLVMAAVIYFIACWLLSRLAEWLPSRMQQRTAAPAEPEPLAPIAAGDPSNVNQIAVAKEVE